MLIVMLGDTFPDVYEIAKASEHTIVSSKKMQPKTIMPLFPNLHPKLRELTIT